MELTSLITQLTEAGIADIATIVIVVLYVRYSASETRREISKEIDDKVGALKSDMEQLIKENRQEIAAHRAETRREFTEIRTETRLEFNESRSTSEQSHKETMLHLIDVRERLANIEGRLGAPTPRMSAVSPPLESPAEEPSAQS